MAKLFVSYSWASPDNHGYGCCEIPVDEPRDIDEILTLAELIRAKSFSDSTKIIVLFWRPFRPVRRHWWSRFLG